MHSSILLSSRRKSLAGLATGAAGTFLLDRRLAAQNVAKPRLINVHHHLTAPAYVKFLVENKVQCQPDAEKGCQCAC